MADLSVNIGELQINLVMTASKLLDMVKNSPISSIYRE